jgi:hypothetical protein
VQGVGNGNSRGEGCGSEDNSLGGCAAGDRTAKTYRSQRRLTAWGAENNNRRYWG